MITKLNAGNVTREIRTSLRRLNGDYVEVDLIIRVNRHRIQVGRKGCRGMVVLWWVDVLSNTNVPGDAPTEYIGLGAAWLAEGCRLLPKPFAAKPKETRTPRMLEP